MRFSKRGPDQAIPIIAALAILLHLALVPLAVAGQGPPTPQEPAAVEMPDESHLLLAELAAQSHGLDATLVSWIGSGPYDEDHCACSPYPPCIPWIPSGWHSWYPDTGEWWTDPFIWPDFGSGLERAGRLFATALEKLEGGGLPLPGQVRTSAGRHSHPGPRPPGHAPAAL
jgi:hypothetical protein